MCIRDRGKPAAVDGFSGEVYIEPDEATKARFAHQIRLRRRQSLSGLALRDALCQTRDGTRVNLYACLLYPSRCV